MDRDVKILAGSVKHSVSMNLAPVSNKCYQHPGNHRVVEMIPGDARIVLDVGCGAGDNARLLKARGMTVDGITLSESEAELARGECRHVWLHNLETGLPGEIAGPYDAVLCSHVLEHICFPEKLLADIRRVLGPEGSLVVALPNMVYFKNRLRLLCGRIEYEEGGVMDNTHFRWYTFASARRLLERNGFERVLAQADGSFPLPGLRRLLPPAWLAPFDRAAVAMLPGLLGHQLLYRYRKAPQP